MALTQAQWYEKLKTWIPGWWFEETGYNEAVLQGLAAVFSASQQNGDDHQAQTYITRADAPFLDAHGDERNVERLPSESNLTYSTRIRNIVNQSNLPDLKSLVDAVLIAGESTFFEHADLRTHAFFNRESFYNRREIYTDLSYNVFSIVLEKQLHEPYSFLNREYFTNRLDFAGSNESSQDVFDQVAAIVNKAKAGGVMYRITERTG